MKGETFVLTETHLALLKRMYVDFSDAMYYGAPAVDIKRPYGNKDVPGDIRRELIGIDLGKIEDIHEALRKNTLYEDNPDIAEIDFPDDMCLALHEETATALQIVLCTQSFEPGVYQKQDEYCSRSWKRIN